MLQIPFRTSTNPDLSWQENNAIIETLRSLIKNSPDRIGARSPEDSDTIGTINLLPHTTSIPPFSVVELTGPNTVTLPFTPTAKSRTGTQQDYRVFATYGAQYATVAGYQLRAHIIGTHRPHLVNYEEADGVPAVGDIVGPIPGGYKASKKYDGLQVVSDPDTTNKRVFVIKQTGLGNVIVMIKLKARLDPGVVTGVNAYPMKWDSGSCTYIEDTSNGFVKAYDPTRWNFILTDEVVFARKVTVDCSGTPQVRYEVLGSHGLRRQSVIPTGVEITCGSIGSHKIRGTSEILSVTNEWGSHVRLLQDDEPYINYDRQQDKWFNDPYLYPISVHASANGDNCGTSPASATSLSYQDRYERTCQANDTRGWTINNDHNLLWKAGATLHLLANRNNKTYDVVQSQLNIKNIPTEFSGDGCSLGAILEKVGLYQCDAVSIPIGLLGFANVDVITGASVSGCGINFTTTTICAGVVGAGTPVSLSFTSVNAVTAVSLDNCHINKTVTPICVIAAGTPTATTTSLATTDVVSEITKSFTGGVCKIEYTKKNVCLISVNSTDANQNLVTAAEQEVVINVHDETDCLYQTQKLIYPLCVDTEETDDPVVCYTTCTTTAAAVNDSPLLPGSSMYKVKKFI